MTTDNASPDDHDQIRFNDSSGPSMVIDCAKGTLWLRDDLTPNNGMRALLEMMLGLGKLGRDLNLADWATRASRLLWAMSEDADADTHVERAGELLEEFEALALLPPHDDDVPAIIRLQRKRDDVAELEKRLLEARADVRRIEEEILAPPSTSGARV